MLLLQILLTCVCLVMLLIGLTNGMHVRRLTRLARRQALPEPPPLISVCVPARNEARNIAACVETLARQDYSQFEILILDDCSEDGTGDIARAVAARHPGVSVRVIDGRPLEPGWIGKPHACRQLAEAARGEWLLFTDADTVWQPWALTKALRLALASHADLFSGLPALRTETFWERLSVPMLALIGAGMVDFALMTRLRWTTYAAASGAFLLFRRESYEAIGGHGAVKGRIVEDVELARVTKRAGRRLVMSDVTRLVEVRMYASLPEVWEGFTKNFYAAFPGLRFLVALAGMLAIFVSPWVVFLLAPFLRLGFCPGTLLPLVQIGALSALKTLVDQSTRRLDLLALLLLPVSGLFFALIALRSAGRQLLRQPTPWRARQYSLWKE